MPIRRGPSWRGLRTEWFRMSFAQTRRNSGNLLLDQLPSDEFDALEPDLQSVNLALKQVVHEFDKPVTHVHFPTTAVISLLTVLQEDDPIESITVGREGFLGIAASLGVEESPHRALCQMDGESFRLPVGLLFEAMGRGPALARLVARYTAFSWRSTSQGIACNALHTVEARASRWLLTAHDQARRGAFPMTQEFMASMLGVRRQSVTVVAGSLQTAGLINYRRGVIKILDRTRLEEAACECYATIVDHYDRVVN